MQLGVADLSRVVRGEFRCCRRFLTAVPGNATQSFNELTLVTVN